MAHSRPEPERAAAGDGIERTIARSLSWAIPLGSLLVAVVVGVLFDVASSFLVLVTGALLGAILLLWYSLRSLAGDVPADPGLDAALASHSPRTELDERKRRALRSLKDLEQEHAIGKIDDEDYAALRVEYRTQAKAVIQEMDDVLAPYRAEAEALVRAHLAKRHIKPAIDIDEKPPEAREAAEEAADPGEDELTELPPRGDGRVHCPTCETVNDPDAAFCKRCGAKLNEAPEDDEAPPEDDT
ncbi:MAG TPA: zinc ribbon domain-containing protein [Polyangiaceae bacterium]|nr:zinc ribbon domain-containing protein [Polyangiaceae bacterium]